MTFVPVIDLRMLGYIRIQVQYNHLLGEGVEVTNLLPALVQN